MSTPVFPNLILAAFLVSSGAHADGWSEDSNPDRMGFQYEHHLERLELSATLPAEKLPWSAPFWPDRDGSIARRWQAREKSMPLSGPTLAELRALSPAEIATLSPAEKIDLLRGRYDYPTLARVHGYALPSDPAWKGICAGWSQAASNFSPPHATVRENPDGIRIPFAAGDLAALAAFYYDFVAVGRDENGPYDDRTSSQIGRKCHASGTSGYCGRDLNPGALHIALANRIGVEKRALLADFSPGHRVAQHPIYGYTAELRGERAAGKEAAPTAIREVRVHLTLFYADYHAAEVESQPLVERKHTLDYWLELDADGEIVGGKYVTFFAGKALDYAWISEPLGFSRGYEVLNELLKPF